MASVRFAAGSDTGRVRKNNQDSGYASPRLLLVADGMGGAAAGDLASAVAVTRIREADVPHSGEEMLTALADVLTVANQQLSALVASDPSLDGMGTTVCGAMFDGERLGLVHIGDSRGYLLRDGDLHQLTHDHSWVQSLIDDGRLTPEQAEVHPHRSLILKVLNGQPAHEPDFELVDVRIGDRVLFCSDGLSGMVKPAELTPLAAISDLDEAVAAMIEAANEAGGIDNITVVLGEIVESSAELDERPGVTVGAATTVEIPEPGEHTGRIVLGDELAADADEAAEAARYSPASTKRRWLGTTLLLLLVVTLLTFGGWAGVTYAKTKVFVGESNELVAVYRGIPGHILGFTLNDLQAEDTTRVADLPKFYQDKVREGIPVADMSAADATLGELRQKAAYCIAIRQARQNPSPIPSPSASGTASAPAAESPSAVASASGSPSSPVSPSGSESPSSSPDASPYPNAPVGPEDC